MSVILKKHIYMWALRSRGVGCSHDPCFTACTIATVFTVALGHELVVKIMFFVTPSSFPKPMVKTRMAFTAGFCPMPVVEMAT